MRTLLLVLFIVIPAFRIAAESPPKIGIITGLSGMAAKWNHYQNNGIRLAQEELAASGMPIELVFEDSKTIGSRAVAAFNKLVEFDKVDMLIADDFGFAIAPLIPLADRRKKLLLSLSLPQDHYCAQSKGYFFSISSQIQDSEREFERFFSLHPEVRRIALFVFEDPEWGGEYQQIWSRVAARRGVAVIDVFKSAEPTPDFKVAVAKALAKRPDALLLAHEPITFLKAVAAAKFSGEILSANNLLELLASNERPGPIIDQVYIVDPKIEDTFAQAYRSRFDEEPILEAFAGYEALRTAARALKANRKYPEKSMRTIRYQGVAGEIDFTGPSCAGNKSNWKLHRFIDGRPVVVE